MDLRWPGLLGVPTSVLLSLYYEHMKHFINAVQPSYNTVNFLEDTHNRFLIGHLSRILLNIYHNNLHILAYKQDSMVSQYFSVSSIVSLGKHDIGCFIPHVTHSNEQAFLCPLLLTWFNFNPSMDK